MSVAKNLKINEYARKITKIRRLKMKYSQNRV